MTPGIGSTGRMALAAVLIAIALLVIPARGNEPGLAEAATLTVNVGQASSGFPAQRYNPASLTIATGDTVRWAWYSGAHDVNSYTGLFNSGAPGGMTQSGDQFTYTFNTPGTYTYYCLVHADRAHADPGVVDQAIADGWMVGKVVVQAADTSGPTVSNLNVTPNPTLGATNVTITATITDAGAVVSNVAGAEFFVGTAGADGSGTAMSPTDGAFSSSSEQATATLNVSAFTEGAYTILVHGRDAAGNWGPTVSVTLNVAPRPLGSVDASILITPGTLANSTSAVEFSPVQITGAALTIETSPSAWRVADGTGTGSGWNVTMTATDFSATGGTIPVANLKVRQLQSKITTVAGNGAPSSQVGSYVALHQSSPLKLLSAVSGSGMGTYDYTPDFQLSIPATIAPGTYQSAIVVSINIGP